jgi:YebC/PmpR family DNA-binding regulatory protein
MSGHSKWATIKHSKGAKDAKRSSIFSKVSKDIVIAVQLGKSGDIEMNPMLRVMVAKARSVNMPSDKIEKAINKGLGITVPGEITYEKTYEAYSSGGVAMLVDVETDNPNRSLTDVRTVINKSGGKLVPEGSISWQFHEKGFILISQITNGINNAKEFIEEKYLLPLMEIDGIQDINYIEVEDKGLIEIRIYTAKEDLRLVNEKVRELFKDANIDETGIIKISENFTDASEEDLIKLNETIESLKEIEDVTNVWVNIKE